MLAREIEKTEPERITIRDAALLIGRSPAEVREFVKAGEIEDVIEGGRTYVVYASLLAFAAELKPQESE